MDTMSTAESGTEQTAEEAWTVGRLLTWTTDYLKRRGSESPRLDAEVMLAHVLDWQRVQLYTHFTDEVAEGPRGRFRDLVRRRVRGVARRLPGRPEGVLLADLRGLAGRPDPPARVGVRGRRVPRRRPRTSNRPAPWTWAPARAAWRSPRPHRQPWARFVAIDISAAALAVARKNAAKHGVADRIDFRLGDRLGPVAGRGALRRDHLQPALHPHRRDPATSRPASGITSRTSPSTAAPTASTWSRGLIEQSVPLLKPGGHLILEIGTAQEKPVRGLIEAHPGFRLAPTIHDHAQHPRVIRATRTAESLSITRRSVGDDAPTGNAHVLVGIEGRTRRHAHEDVGMPPGTTPYDGRSDPLPLGRHAPQGLGQGAHRRPAIAPCGGRSASGGSRRAPRRAWASPRRDRAARC